MSLWIFFDLWPTQSVIRDDGNFGPITFGKLPVPHHMSYDIYARLLRWASQCSFH